MTFTGDVDDDESDVTQDRDWSDYWRLLFKKVSVDDIKTFEKDYKGSCHKVVSVCDITKSHYQWKICIYMYRYICNNQFMIICMHLSQVPGRLGSNRAKTITVNFPF